LPCHDLVLHAVGGRQAIEVFLIELIGEVLEMDIGGVPVLLDKQRVVS
jgi:hypothetical protein